MGNQPDDATGTGAGGPNPAAPPPPSMTDALGTAATQPPPPPPAQSDQVDLQNPDTKWTKVQSFVNRLTGGGAPALKAKVEEHHQRQMAEIDMYNQNMRALSGLLMKANMTGMDPRTGKPIDPAALQQLHAQYDAAKGAMLKLTGKSKESKQIGQQMTGVLDHLTGRAQQGQSQPTGGANVASPAPPPQMSATQQQEAIPAQMAMAGQQNEQDQHMAALRAGATVKGEEAVAAPSQMMEGLKKAGFTEEEAKDMIRAKTQGKAGRPDKPHWVVISDPNDATSRIPAWQDPITHKVYDADNNEIEHAHIVQPGLLPTTGTTETPFIDAQGNTVLVPTKRTSQKMVPGSGSAGGAAAPSSGGSSRKGSAPAPPKAQGGVQPSSSFGRMLGSIYPARQANIFMAPAQGANLTVNSLLGEKPYSEPGGLMQDLAVFDNPESKQRITEYLNFFDKALSLSSKAADAQGPTATIGWWAGLPQQLSNLQAQAAQEVGQSLTPEEQRYIADRFRVLGTISGMRKSTGAPAAQWSFENLQREVPTPGPTMTRSMAEMQIKNLVKEVNQLGELNHMIKKVDVDKLAGSSKLFKVDGRQFHIPPDKVEAFKKKYPNAVAQ